LVDFQQYFMRFATPILLAVMVAETGGSPMKSGPYRDFSDAISGQFRDNSTWANPVTDVRRACHDY
jgi:hypothetical protein